MSSSAFLRHEVGPSGDPGNDVGSCSSCGSTGMSPFYERSGVPVHNSLRLTSREEALGVPTGDIRLEFCPGCGFVQNSSFDPLLVTYGEDYEDTQAHSPRFVEFAEELIAGLSERHRLEGGHVVEIGCGSGDFLSMLCHHAGCTGVGYDPSYHGGAIVPPEGVNFVRELYPPARPGPSTDLVVCRHTLEHVPDVAGFVTMVREHAGEAPVFFEVPDVGRVLDEGAFWDVYYEHCSYFTETSLASLFSRAGYETTGIRLGYDDQYLLLEATPDRVSTGAEDRPIHPIGERCGRFAARVAATLDTWNEYLAGAAERGEKVVLWSGGSKAVAFVTSIGRPEAIDGVVDINPAKQGKYLPGTGHQIVAPSELEEDPPSSVILMNPVYREEITEDLRRRGISSEVLTL